MYSTKSRGLVCVQNGTRFSPGNFGHRRIPWPTGQAIRIHWLGTDAWGKFPIHCHKNSLCNFASTLLHANVSSHPAPCTLLMVQKDRCKERQLYFSLSKYKWTGCFQWVSDKNKEDGERSGRDPNIERYRVGSIHVHNNIHTSQNNRWPDQSQLKVSCHLRHSSGDHFIHVYITSRL